MAPMLACLLATVCLLLDIEKSAKTNAFAPGRLSTAATRTTNPEPHGHFATVAPTITNDDQKEESSSPIRPLTENWWPAIALSSLDQSKPNPLQILGHKLVSYYDKASSSWVVLDDRCSHRFAPLSEGRVKHTETGETRLQCAYHGWEFKPCGACACVPQQPGSTGKGVRSYPVQERVGILWVWTGNAKPDPKENLPISELLQRHVDFCGSDSVFMRDLPYGMELLGENLLDLSHLPYSHHSIGTLDRKLGREMQLKRVVPDSKNPGPTPLYKVEVQNAGEQDPIFIKMSDSKGTRKEWTTFISFYSPCHIRYERSRDGQAIHVEIFILPLLAGKSRVFLFNCFELILPSSKDLSFGKVLRAPKHWKAALQKKLLQEAFKSSGVRGHMQVHRIFDGDGIFLHKQGNRMSTESLTYRDYSTPSSADVMLNAFRRFLDKAASKADKISAQSVSGDYDDAAPRSVLLDRYESHTVLCQHCSKGLKRSKRSKARWSTMRTALTGASGAFAGMTALSLAGAVSGVAVPAVAAACGVSGISSFVVSRLERRAEAKIQSFFFEDYVHAEKD